MLPALASTRSQAPPTKNPGEVPSISGGKKSGQVSGWLADVLWLVMRPCTTSDGRLLEAVSMVVTRPPTTRLLTRLKLGYSSESQFIAKSRIVTTELTGLATRKIATSRDSSEEDDPPRANPLRSLVGYSGYRAACGHVMCSVPLSCHIATAGEEERYTCSERHLTMLPSQREREEPRQLAGGKISALSVLTRIRDHQSSPA